MKQSKFFKLLQTLSKLELQKFAEYLKKKYKGLGVPYHLFKHVSSYAPNYMATIELDRDYLIQTYLNTSTNQGSIKRFQNELSKLFLVLKEFLLWQKFQQQAFEKNLMLAEILRERKLDGEAEKALSLALKSIYSPKKEEKTTSKPIDGWDYLKRLKYYHFLYYSAQSFPLASKSDNLQLAMQHLDIFYAGTKLKYSCEIKSRDHILNEQHQIFLLEDLNKNIAETELSKLDLIQAYQKTLNLITHSSEESFHQILRLLHEEKNTIAITDKKIILTYLLNFCISRVRAGDTNYMDTIFNVYAFAVKKQLFLDQGVISPTRFNNVVDAACKIGQFSWVENFLRGNTKYLNPDIREETINIANAMIHFAREEYDEVLVKLRDGSFKNIDHSLRARWLMICCLCASNKIKILNATCEATRQYLKRNKSISKKLTKATQNLIVIVNRISKYQYIGKGKDEKKRLLEKLEQTNPIVYKLWLKKKIQQL